jgi:hypothetical protein
MYIHVYTSTCIYFKHSVKWYDIVNQKIEVKLMNDFLLPPLRHLRLTLAFETCISEAASHSPPNT